MPAVEKDGEKNSEINKKVLTGAGSYDILISVIITDIDYNKNKSCG
ncbi:MAG: hypothetical protein LUE65_12075 [Clostridiales bacterium]|nr:hypothetical protein [Clostridiales bacterium]